MRFRRVSHTFSVIKFVGVKCEENRTISAIVGDFGSSV